MVEADLAIRFVSRSCGQPVSVTAKEKAGAVEHPQVFDRAGLLVDEPSGCAGMLFV